MRHVISGERGFALPMTILIVAMLTLVLTSGFTRVRADLQIAAASEETAAALGIAQSGLQTYLGMLNTDGCERPIRPPDGDSVRINVTGGYADVVARVLQQPADTTVTWMYLIESRGYMINPLLGPEPRAQRTVAQFARWQWGNLGVRAAWTAANGINRLPDSWQSGDPPMGEFKGDDNTPPACEDPPINAIRVPLGEAPPDMVGFTLDGVVPRVYETGTPKDVADSTRIDWGATLTGAIVPDFTAVQNGNMNYPVTFVTGDLTIGNVGTTVSSTGLLIVTGDLRIRGNYFWWGGIILVGGRVILDALDQRVDGMLVTGLNEQLGIAVPKTDLGGGDDYTDIDYWSIYNRRAMRSLTGFVPIGNAWIDNWATY